MPMAFLKAIAISIFSLWVAFLSLACSSAHADGGRFGYSGSTGPDKWGSLSSEFNLCSTGNRQSPINIVKRDAVHNPNLGTLDRDYIPRNRNASLVNTGLEIELLFDQAPGRVLVDGKKYKLVNLHWHSPSEHTINGERRFPVELHLVHRSEGGGIAVVAILYKYGHPDSFLLQLKKHIDKLGKNARRGGEEEARVPVGIVRTRSLSRHTRKYFRYVGSLTTPPCTENVVWSILGKVREMSREQASALRALLPEENRNNSRPTQRLNGRTVQLYDESRQG
ncbi:alpha carbonic anhydrase 1, chloroplastic isoform X2 [Canna indica]|uniref:Alpha carbonic anhydrase 1, chloroplastic isoform X2 n=1 Tax=Canna indica TaxID=4628 RepID=A0AAQ3K5K3_9LILI|nr:alpha carbonic anhydrase 1, chloroplastic isoform X2 [Canna indica]